MNIKIIHPKVAFIPIGIPACGKSTLAGKYFNEHEIWGADKVRQMLAGKLYYFHKLDGAAFRVLEDIVIEQARIGMPLFIDNMNIDGKSRRKFVTMLRGEGYKIYYIMFTDSYDVPLCQERNKARGSKVADEVVTANAERFAALDVKALEKECDFFYLAKDVESIERVAPIVDKNRVLFFGDIHGQYTKLLKVLESHGYREIGGLPTVPANAPHFVFLGDLIDRGEEFGASYKTLKLIKSLVDHGLAHTVMGNHEENVVRIMKGQNIESDNSQKTVQEFRKLCSEQEYTDFVAFLTNLPLVLDVRVGTKKIVASHAGCHFDEGMVPGTHLVPDGFRRWMTLRGVPSGRTDNRGYRGIYTPGELPGNQGENAPIQLFGHVNQSKEITGTFQAPYEDGKVICLESHAEEAGFELCTMEFVE